MIKSKQPKCPNCQMRNVIGATTCSQCGTMLAYAYLKSLGSGSAPKGFTWPLYASDSSLGAGPSNDIIVPSDRIPLNVCQLLYKDGHYYAKVIYPGKVFLHGKSLPPDEENCLRHGDVIKVGLDKIQIHYNELNEIEKSRESPEEKLEAKTDFQQCVNPVAARLMLILGYLQELHTSLDLHEILNCSLDAVLKVTGLDRAYAFVANDKGLDEVDLQELASRTANHKDIVEEQFSISQSMLQEALKGGEIIVEDADELAKAPEHHSIQEFKIRSLVCIPLIHFDQHKQSSTIQGVLYADKLLSKSHMPNHCRSTLHLLAQMTSGNINRLQEFEKMRQELQLAHDALDDCERVMVGLKQGLETSLKGLKEDGEGNKEELLLNLEKQYEMLSRLFEEE